MASEFGKNIRITVFGQSHSEGIGVVIDGLPAGESVDLEQVRQFMARRRPSGAVFSTKRSEADIPKILSGLSDGSTCGAPLCAVIANTDTRSGDYANLKDIPRPGHSDYPAYIKYKGENDVRGGGHFSGRLTAPLCFAGAVCMQILARKGIFIGAHLAQIGQVKDRPFDPVSVSEKEFAEVAEKPFPVLEDTAGEAMLAEIAAAGGEGDSVGGIIECAAVGLPAGLGDPMFEGVENRMAQALFGIPAVKGLEFGAGFAVASLRGSENNDAYYWKGERVCTKTNHHGGILGGITTGMPLLFRIAVKPTPSIGKEQDSVSLSERTNSRLLIHGRHDSCIVPRAVPVAEAVSAAVLLDLWMDRDK